MVRIDRSSPLPYYAQVAETLRDYIRAGHWESGEMLPSEPALCEMFDVSRTVIRQALSEMTHEGMVIRRKGKGTFVAESKLDYGLSTLISFSKMMQSRGQEVTTLVLDQRIVPAPLRVAQTLGLEPGDEVVLIRRLRSIDDVPAAIHASYLDARRFSGLLDEDLAGQSLWDAIEKIDDARAGRVKDVVEAKLLSQEEAELLRQGAGGSALLVEGVAFDTSDRPLLYTRALNRGDRFRFVAESGHIGIGLFIKDEELANLGENPVL